jgi:RNA polymerase sigma factor (sigma-70 family)
MQSLGETLERYRLAKHVETKLRIAEQIADEIAPKLWNYLARRCPPEEVEDLRQEVMMAVVLGLDRCEADSAQQFWGWIYTIARNKLATRLEKRGRMIPVAEEELWRLIEASGEVEAITRNERQELAESWAMLQSLDEHTRTCLWLHHFDGREYAEIAEEMGTSKDAIRMTIKRGLEAAQKLLEGRR